MNNGFQMDRMRSFFENGSSWDPAFRQNQLRQLQAVLQARESVLSEALYADLYRSKAEAWLSETGYVLSEIRYALRHLKNWSRPHRVPVPIGLHPARACTVPEPKGVVLILSPWNYPLQLMLSPLVSAIAAGNGAVLKPSEFAPHTSAALHTLIKDTFDPDYIQLIEGDAATAQELAEQPFDHIFFTGGTQTGQKVAAAAAKNLTPVTLELGGKNPAILCEDTNLRVAARRIARGRLMNAGQLCVAPDLIWVPRALTEPFARELGSAIQEFYGDHPQTAKDYGRIINRHHFDRLQTLLAGITPFSGGAADPQDLYIEPTVILNPPRNSALMQEEIFGPLLTLCSYDRPTDPVDFHRRRAVPLALYLFTDSRARQHDFMRAIPSGGVCINDTVVQLIPQGLPFGGRKESGIGASGGKAGFDAFSHFRSVLRRHTFPDPKALYPPYRIPLKILKTGCRLGMGR